MQPIERFGVAALLFLVVTIGAVVLWDQAEGDPTPTPGDAARTEVAAAPTGQRAKLDGLSRDTLASERRQPQQPTSRQPSTTHVAGSEPTTVRAGGSRWGPGQAVQLNDRKPAVQPQPVQPVLVGGDPSEAGGASSPNPGGDRSDIGGMASKPVKPQPKPSPAPAAPKTYTVAPGDTMGQIAQDQLGSVRHLAALQAANPSVRPEAMSVGTKLVLPAVPDAPVASASGSAGKDAVAGGGAKPKPSQPAPAGRTYTVEPGDSLWSIAQAQLGDGLRHGELAALNPGSGDMLRVGQVLRLPAGAAPTAGRDVVAAATPRSQPSQPTVKRGVVR
jgi:LysM repeat protein